MKNIKKYEEFKLDEGILGNIYNRTLKRKQIDKLSELAVELILILGDIAQSINSNSVDLSSIYSVKKVKEKFLNSMPIDIKFPILEQDRVEEVSSNVHENLNIKMVPKKDLSCLIVYFTGPDSRSWDSTVSLVLPPLYSLFSSRDVYNLYQRINIFSKEYFSELTFQLTESTIESTPVISKREIDRFEKNCLTHIMSLYYLNYTDHKENLSSIIKLLSITKKYIVASEEDIQEFILGVFESKYKEYFKGYKTPYPSVAHSFACAHAYASAPMSQKSEKDIPRGMILDLISIVEIISKPFDYLMKLKNTELIISEISKESSDAFHKIEQSLPPEYRHKAGISKDLGDLGF